MGVNGWEGHDCCVFVKESVERLLKKGTSRVLFDLGDGFSGEAAEYSGADPFVLTPNPNAVVGGNPVGSGVMSSFSSCSIYCPLSFTYSIS